MPSIQTVRGMAEDVRAEKGDMASGVQGGGRDEDNPVTSAPTPYQR